MSDVDTSPPSDEATQPCPACAEPVRPRAFKCPHCGERLRELIRPGQVRMAGCLGPFLALLASPFAVTAVLFLLTDPEDLLDEPGLGAFVLGALLVFGGGLFLSFRHGRDKGGGLEGGGARLSFTVVSVAVVCAGSFCLAIPNFVGHRHHHGGNETAAIGALKTISSAQALFREADKENDGNLDYGSLTELASAGTTGLIDSVLGSGTKQGYYFQATYSKTTSEFIWFAVAEPALPGTTGDRYFAVNHEWVIFYSTTAPFQLNDTDCQMPPFVNPVGK